MEKPNEESSKSIFQILVESAPIIPVLSVVVVLLGFFNLYSQYNFYGIDITSYVEPTEILFSFSSLFFNLVYFGCLTSSLIIADIGIRPDISKSKTSFSGKMTIVVYLIIGVVYLVSKVFFINSRFFYFDILSGILVIGFALLVKKATASSIYRIVLMTIIIVLTIHVRNYTGYYLIVEKNSEPIHIELELNDGEIIRSSKDFLYVGSTRNYIFFWNSESKKVALYSLGNLKNAQFKRDNVKGVKIINPDPEIPPK